MGPTGGRMRGWTARAVAVSAAAILGASLAWSGQSAACITLSRVICESVERSVREKAPSEQGGWGYHAQSHIGVIRSF